MSEVFNADVLDAINRALSAENVVTREGEEPVYCNVNNKTREIEIPGEITIFGVEHDENAVRVFFKCPKIIGDNVDIDITQSMVYIIYINAGGEKDQYIVTDVNETEDGYATFSWLINRKPAKYQGITQFGIRVIKSKTGGEIENEWNTTVANANILNGVETEDIELSGDNIDVVNQLLDLTKQEIELKKQNSIEEIEQKGQETLETIPSDYTTVAQNALSAKNEVEDIRVGFDGTVYKSAGEAVRSLLQDFGNVIHVDPFIYGFSTYDKLIYDKESHIFTVDTGAFIFGALYHVVLSTPIKIDLSNENGKYLYFVYEDSKLKLKTATWIAEIANDINIFNGLIGRVSSDWRLDYISNTIVCEMLEKKTEQAQQSGIFTVTQSDNVAEIIMEAMQYTGSIVYIDPYEHDCFKEWKDYFGEDYFETLSSGRGIELQNDIHIIGRSGCKLKLHYTGNNDYVQSYFSLFNNPQGGTGYTIENVNFETSKIRYCIHDERGSDSKPYKVKYSRCKFSQDNSESSWDNSRACIGGGMGLYGDIIVEDCVFDTVTSEQNKDSVAYHNSIAAGAKNSLVIKGCYCKGDSTLQIASYGNSTLKSDILISNNSFGSAIEEYHWGPQDNFDIMYINNEIRSSS